MLVVHSNTRYETEKSLLTGLMSFCTICFYGKRMAEQKATTTEDWDWKGWKDRGQKVWG